MNDDLYFEFEMQWLGRWRKARYTATRAQLEDRYPGSYRIIGDGIRRLRAGKDRLRRLVAARPDGRHANARPRPVFLVVGREAAIGKPTFGRA